ncbi:LPS export ABC transporter permease LptF [Paracoccus xiamenensis]|uniref:LPS export ABC transporter permease LptF n=1 Tax=Paracoccus xiamenensis TaxID=2714901 RepID=UPI00140E3FF4|nr:LPS export ABC transporter permease LptF [Paracoccus xiamenensis]NHF74284.1 LPS export ABC transporter permease LptF [Paracoccus xiamenensis]
MKRIDRYILKTMLILFGFFALVLVAVYWVNRAVSLFERLIGDGQTAMVVLEFTLLTLPVVISIVLPVAAFAATAYGTNRLSGESELVAMQAAGLSPWRLARPVLVFGIIIALMVAALVHALVPMARDRLAERQAQIAENVTAQFLNAGVFQYPAPGITLFIREITPLGELDGMFLEDARNPADVSSYSAERALLVKSDTGPKLVMVNGVIQSLRQTEGAPRLSVTRFADMTYDLGALMGASSARGRDLRDYSTAALLTPDQALLDATGATPARARLEAHSRIAQPLLSPVAAMLGFATLLVGGFSRFGVWRQVGWAVVALIFVQLLTNWAANRAGDDPALWPLVYLPAAVGAAICIALLAIAAAPNRPLLSRLRGGSNKAPSDTVRSTDGGAQ